MIDLIKKYLRFKTTNEEEQKLYKWVNEDSKHLDTFKKEVEMFFNLKNNNVLDTNSAFKKFNNKVTDKSFINFKKIFKYAAAILIIVSSTYTIVNLTTNKSHNKVSTNNNISHSKSNMIELTLEDGTKKTISDAKKELSYLNSEATINKLVYNELSVPKGEVFQIILSDSTKVWLNSETKLRFPKKFISSSKTRTVFLEGEAYFEVAHNTKLPFIVNTNRIDVKVLGTKFNVSSYDSDAIINTTLVEGSVKVIDSTLNASLVLEPNFQASFSKKEAELTKRKVDAYNYIDWVNNRIIFNNITFSELLIKIERKYNVEIINKNEALNDIKFNGEFDIENIEIILKALSTSYHFNYEITGNKILIKN